MRNLQKKIQKFTSGSFGGFPGSNLCPILSLFESELLLGCAMGLNFLGSLTVSLSLFCSFKEDVLIAPIPLVAPFSFCPKLGPILRL